MRDSDKSRTRYYLRFVRTVVKIETCESCGVKISENEQAYVHNSQILCKKCYAKVTKELQSRRTIILIFIAFGGLGIGFVAGVISYKYGFCDIRRPIFKRNVSSKSIISVNSVNEGGGWIFIELKNTSGRDISGAIGNVVIFDQFGESLLTLKASCDEPLLNGETLEVRWFSGGPMWEQNDRTRHLIQSGKVTAEFVARHVNYTDGTRESFEP